MTNLSLVVGILPDSALEELQLILEGSQALCAKKDRMVCMPKGVKAEVCVSEFSVNLVAQQAIGSLTNAECQGREGGHLSPFPWWT